MRRDRAIGRDPILRASFATVPPERDGIGLDAAAIGPWADETVTKFA